MIKKHYMIATDTEPEIKFAKVEGYIKQAGDYWFGIHKPEGSWFWTITELSTGRRVKDGRTLKECEQKLPECASTVETFFNSRYKELFRAIKEKCEKAYLKSSDTELTDVFYKITGGFR